MVTTGRSAGVTACCLFAIVSLIPGPALAQKTKPEKRVPDAASTGTAKAPTPPSSENEDPTFKGMKYRVVGPFRGGRSLTASGIPGDPTTYYFGGTGGGVWKSTDGALTWSSVFDKEGTSAIFTPI